MANTGLKEYNSFLDFSIGGLTIKINLSSVNRDFFILSPLTLQIGRMPLNLSILYSHNNQNEVAEFGKGIRCSLYKEIEETNNYYWTVKNFDFSSDLYDRIDSSNYKNTETGNIICKQTLLNYNYSYNITDKEGNKIEYNDSSNNYFKSIDIKGKAQYSITYPTNQIVYKNYFNDSLTLNKANGRVYNCFYCDSGSYTTLFETILSYDNQNRLTSILLKKGNDNLRNETINYGTNSYEIIDNITGNKIVVTINSSTTTVEEYLLTNLISSTTITYSSSKTKISNNLGQETIRLFDSEGIEITSIEDNLAVGKIYHKDYKKPTLITNEFRIKNIDNSIFIPELSSFQTVGVYKSLYDSQVDSDLANIITSPYQVSQNGYIYLDKIEAGTANDYLTFLVWAKEISLDNNPEFSISITINGETETTKVDKLNTANNFRLLSVGIRPLRSYTNLRLKISVSNCTVVFGGLQLINKGFGTSYEYDSSINLIKVKDKLGTKEYSYDSNNKLDEALDYRGNENNYEYNQEGQVEYVQSSYGVIQRNEYDDSNKYNLIKKTYFTILENINNDYTYNNEDLIKTKDEFNYETNYGYDAFKNVSSVLRLNVDLINYNYNNNNFLYNITRNPSTDNDIENLTYDSYRRLSSVTTPSNSVYSFTYDNYNNVTAVKINNENLLTFTYDSNQMLTGITYPNGDNYLITYSNNYKTIASISINNQITYTYSYDVELKLIGITNQNITKTYEYDLDNKIKNQKIRIPYNYSNNELNIDYKYLYDELKFRIRTINGTFAESYNSKNVNKGSNPSILENYVNKNSNVFVASYNNPVLLNNSYYYYAAVKGNDKIIPLVESGEPDLDILTRAGEMNVLNMINSDRFISYNCHGDSPQGNRVTIGMWIKPTQANSRYIFSIKKDGTGNKPIYAKFENNKIKISMSISGTEYNLIESTETLSANKWHFIAYNYYEDYYEDEEESYDVYVHELYVGGHKQSFTATHSDYMITSFSNIKYFIGYKRDGYSVSNKFIGYITGIIMSNGANVLEAFIKDYYRVSYEKLINNKVDYNSIEYSEATYYVENNNYNIVDKIPLRGFFDTVDNKKPKYCDSVKRDNACIESSFTFDKIKGSYAYSPNSVLCYEYQYNNTGSFILKFKTYDSYATEQIMEINHSTDHTTIMGLYINGNYLYVNLLGYIYSTNITVTKDTWHKVGLSYLFNGSTLYLKVFYDNYEDTYSRNTGLTISYIDLIIGSSYEYNNLSKVFFGQIMDVILTNTYISQSDFNNIINTNYGVSKSEYYDSLGRIRKEIINYDGYEALVNTYTYDKTRIMSENLSGISRSYMYEEERNYIKSITDSTFGNHTYTYDSRGYLLSDNTSTYTYDGNGNIMSANNVYGGYVYYNYSSTYKDRLDSVSGTTVYYNSNNPYYPSSFGNMTFTYEGRRLKTITISGKTITNYYDDEGIRYKKEVLENSVTKTTLYYYDNHKLITEIENGVRRDYIYDSLGNVYGYVLLGTSYYYIKDSLGIIHGIKDASGQVLATYTYDAYGNIISQSDTTTNHIKYKGYYYDEEIGMYYLLSRFYYPYWRRFLTPDNYTYLDFNDINQLNLFAYCNNNPVMYSDEDGSFPILTLILVGTFALGFGSSLFMNAATNNWQLDWRDFLQAGVDGAFAVGATMLAMTGIGFAGSIAAGAAMGWSQYAIGVGIQGDSITLVGSLTAIGIGALGGAISGAGAANSANIGKNMIGLSDDGVRAIGAITNAANRKAAGIISAKGLQATFNLYGKTAFNAVQAAIPGTMRRLFLSSARKIAFYTVLANASQSGLNYGYKAWGLI